MPAEPISLLRFRAQRDTEYCRRRIAELKADFERERAPASDQRVRFGDLFPQGSPVRKSPRDVSNDKDDA